MLQEAEKSIEFYNDMRGKSKNSKLLQMEMNKLQTAIKQVKLEKSDETSLKWSDFTAKTARKSLGISIAVVVLSQFNGVVAMQNYTAIIFHKSGSKLSPNISTIIVGAIQLLGSILSTNLVDRAGRKVTFFFILNSTDV